MSNDLFYVVSYDEGGALETEGTGGGKRLVCNVEGGGKLAIWGSEHNQANLDVVLAAGLPCVVGCASVESEPWAAEKYGHTDWVPEHVHLAALSYVDMASSHSVIARVRNARLVPKRHRRCSVEPVD